MKQYINLGKEILKNGVWIYNKRTGKKCLTKINADLEYDCSDMSFPLVTTRKAFYKSSIVEILGYLLGLSSAKDFRNLGTKTWDQNANVTKSWLKNPNRKGLDDMGRSYRFRESGYYVESKIIKSTRPDQINKSINFEITDLAFLKDNLLSFNLDYNKFIIILLEEWNTMINSCYKIKNNKIIDYLTDEDFVIDDYLNFENFVNDFFSMDNWELKIQFPNEYKLNKSFYHSNYYSYQTIRFSSEKEILMNEKEISKTTETPLSYVEIDQFKLIYAKLKLGIDDRRLIMSAWQPHSDKFSCLPACMHTHTFSLVNDTLYLTSYQRSIDTPLGLVFNMPQTAFLLCLMAQITGYKPGKVYHKLVNCHIYEDQYELFKEQMDRKPFKEPKFKINERIKNFEDLYSFNKDDIEVFDYEYHPSIAFPFSE